MERQFNYEDQYDRAELISWLQNHSEAGWQSYIEFTLSENHKRDFKREEKNALMVAKKFLMLRDFSTLQLKMVAWSYNIVQRIESLKASELLFNQADKDDDGFNQMLRHITLRVAWHDNQWNGTVCNDPAKNVFCNGYHSLLSDRIRREKEKILDDEIKFAGQPVEKMLEETGNIPPCFWSINIFGENTIPVKHINPAARNTLDPIKDSLPKNAMFSWPFAFSFIRNNAEFKANGKYPANLDKVRVPRFRGKIKSNHSIGFIYAKFSNPLSYEEMKYLIVGCGIISEKGDSTYFGPIEEIEKIKNKKRELRNFPTINWAIRFSFDPETLVRIPYHEYIAEAKRRALDEETKDKLLDKIKVTIDEPELEHCFKYVAMDIDDDEAIFILTKMRSKLIDSITDGIVDNDWLNEQINKLDGLLEFCWSRRTHFPGFRYFARTLLDKQENEKCILDNFVEKIKESEPDYCNKINELITNPNSDPDYKIYSNILNELNGVLKQLDLTTDQFLLLSMLNLSFRQFNKIKSGKISSNHFDIKSISENPYLLFEEYEPDEDPQDKITGDYLDFPIELFKIDIALFPNIDYLPPNYLQERFHITDPQRIRALINQYLKSLELINGDCFDSAEHIQTYLQNYPLFYKSKNTKLLLPDFFLEKTDSKYDAHLNKKLEIILANDTKYYYLKKIFAAEKDVKDFILQLINSKEPNNLSYENLGEYLEKSLTKLQKSIGSSFPKEAFIQERKCLYENIFPNKFCILAGNPGSGKSYEILNIIKYFISKGESYLLLTPTGKAALRLKFDEDFRDCKIQAMTIDKFINQWRKNPSKRKQYNNIIIDEMSMVDLIKFESVLRCFEPDDPKFHRLILVGDPYQLPPIGFGKPFYDIINFIKTEKIYEKFIIELDVNCRQELEGNEILSFSKFFTNEIDLTREQIEKIEKGGHISNGFNISYWASENDLIKCLETEWTKLADSLNYKGSSENKLNNLFAMKIDCINAEDIQFNMERFQVITPYRYFTDKINEYYQKEIRNLEEIDILSLFKHRDKIIRTKNFYRGDELILSNGSIGMSIKWNKDKILCFSELEDNYISVYGENGIREYEKDFFELAYCITVHKSQGSGFDHLIVILPKRYGLLCKELFYTALTRSKKSISILIEGEPNKSFEDSLFEFARRRTYTANRKTTLMLDSPYRNYGLEPEKGIFVQSRVEHIIYRHLLDFKLKYNELLSFDFAYEQFPVENELKIKIKTDFTIYTRKGTYYWEHLGLLNKHTYKSQWLNYKLPEYKLINVLDRLITTDESNGINDDKIKSIIQDILDGNLKNEDRYCTYSNHHYYLR